MDFDGLRARILEGHPLDGNARTAEGGDVNESKALIVANVAIVALFTILAIVFGRWWIVLLSYLIMMDQKESESNGK